jgi:hypothetical protein
VQWLSSRRVDSEVVLRALAITAVCLNHSYPVHPIGFGGGLTVLLMLSGLWFARFALQGASPQTLRPALAKFGLRLFVPCLAIILASFAVRREFSLTELLFISSWFSTSHLAFLFVWYPQTIIQILLVLAALFSIRPLADAFFRNPLFGSLALLAACLLIRQATVLLLAPERITPPVNVAWNFFLGWVLYFALRDWTHHHLARKALLLALCVVCALAGRSPMEFPFWTVAGACAVIIFIPWLRLPSPLARAAYIVSQASFTIFLLHVIFLRIYTVVLGGTSQFGAFLFAMTCCTLTWVLIAASTRAYSFMRGQDALAGTSWLRSAGGARP